MPKRTQEADPYANLTEREKVALLARELRDFFDDNPSIWEKGYYAQNALGEGAVAEEPEAVKWCVVGGLRRITHGHQATDEYTMMGPWGKASTALITELEMTVAMQVGTLSLTGFNDRRSTKFADVKKILDVTAERLNPPTKTPEQEVIS